MRKTLFLSLAALALIGVASATQRPQDEIFLDEDQKSGLIDMGNGDDMFYWLFKSRSSPDTDPLVIWLTGGPGCASEVALFYENGPYTINDDLSLNPNQQAWN